MSSLLQWNCRGLVANWAESKMFFLLLAPLVIALQETWFLPTDPYDFSLFNYSLYRYDETDGERRHGGAALYVSNDFVHDAITLNTPLQAVACTVRLNGRNIDICSIYIPPNTDNAQLERNLTHLVAQFKHPFLLLGDFNAHNPLWGHNITTSDTRGDIIERFLDLHNLVLLNKGDNTHFSLSHNSESAIDLSICSPQISTLFDWSVDCDIHHSDHYPIKINTTFDSRDGITNFIPRWNFTKADWGKFQEFCNIDHEQFQSPEHGIMFLTNTILSAANTSIPTTSPSIRRKSVPWWTTAVAQAIAKRKRAFRSFLRHRDEAHRLARNHERARCKKIIREAKRSSWRSFLSQFTHTTPLSKIWSLVRSLSGKRSITNLPVLRLNGMNISEPTEIVNTIAATFSRCSSSDNYSPEFIERSRREFVFLPHSFDSDNAEIYNVDFTMSELRDAISSAGSTSTGPDKLHYAFFRQLPENTLQFMLLTLNDLWHKQIFPAAWREAIVIPILKPGKDKSNPANYRPISLTSCFGKIFERMVGIRLNWFLEENSLLTRYQSGFRKNHTTYDHIVRLETDIRKGFKYKKSTTAVFLDISRAYDMVHKPILIYKLHKIGIRGNLAKYLLGFLSENRIFQVRFRSVYSDTHSLQNGLPQGSCISPTLFNIMINDLFDTVPPNIAYSLFADDCAIWCTDHDSEHSIPRLQRALNSIEVWSKKNGFIFSPTKSAVVTFSKNNRMRQASQLQLSGSIIPRLNSFKFLGIVLDARLSMNKHVEYIKSKCVKRLNLVRCLAGTDYGADRKTLLHLYKTLVLPIIEYGAVIYSGASENTLKKIDTIQNSFLRVALGVMKTSPIPSLQVEAVMPPLHLRRMEQTIRYTSKVLFHPHHAAFNSLHVLPSIHHNYVGPAEKRSGLTIASRVKKFSSDLGYIIPDISPTLKLAFPPWMMNDRDVMFLFTCSKTLYSSREIQQQFLELRDNFNHFQFIFTDGSKEGERTSNSVYCGFNQHVVQHRLPNNTSIFIAELHAVLTALHIIDRRNMQKTVICTDSRSVVQSLATRNPSSTMLRHICNIHQDLTNAGRHIKFLWIPGHCGIQGNEQADKFAKEALNLNNITDTETEYQSIKTTLRHSVLKHWQTLWADIPRATQLRRIKTRVEVWSTSNRNNRREEKVLARLRLGHTAFTHGFIYSGEARPICNPCQHPLTVEHILVECPLYRLQRGRLIDYCTKENIPFCLSSLLGDTQPELLDLMFSFLKGIKLFDKL